MRYFQIAKLGRRQPFARALTGLTLTVFLGCGSAEPPEPKLRPAGDMAGSHEGAESQSQSASNPVAYPTRVDPAILRGTRDEKGYLLPLDVRRPKARRPAGEPPSRGRIETLRALRSQGGANAIPERRLGPDNGHTQNETSIDADGMTVVAGWNQFTDAGLFQGIGRSEDGGDTWTWQVLGGSFSLMSDPVVASGGDGKWYFAFIGAGGTGGGDIDVYVQRSVDDAQTWSAPVPVTANTVFDDKPYMAARGDEVLIAWADFGFSPAEVTVARSLDGGQTFGNTTILSDQSTSGNGAEPVIAADGTYYVFWRASNQQFLWMSKSTNQGATWSQDAQVAAMDPLPSTLPGGFRMVNLPSAEAHPIDGTLLVVWHDEAFGDADILSVRSTDGGDTWSAPVRVNDDSSGQRQFFPWVTFDDDGTAYAVWYDRRGNGSDIDVYLASSPDAGLTWSANRRITQQSFTPVLPWEDGAASFIGDYNGVAASGGRVYPFYQDAREGNQDVWVAIIETGALFADGFETGNTSSWDGAVP